jgi:O-antigen/teichoic acid export membrane protein
MRAAAITSPARTKHPPGLETAATVRERGAVGAVLLTIRAAGAQVVAFFGTLVLAHQLLPSAFGVVAFGATVIAIGNFVADGGLGASLIRKPTDPTPEELRTLLALQLALATAIAIVVAAVGSRAGTVGGVTALMAVSLPLLAVRAPHVIALERALEYRPVAQIEFIESVVYYGWAIATVAIGWGVWGLASAAVVRAAAGSVLMARASPLRTLTPRLERSTLQSMLAFGLGVQAVGIAGLARTQGVNLVIAAVGGEQLLGLWSLATRLLMVPFWLFQALWRVSYPVMARLRSLGEDTPATVARLAAMTALVSGAFLAPLAASAHDLIPGVFGSRWAPAAAPLVWACAGLVVSGPVSVASSGYLFSENDVRSPLKAATTSAIVFVGLTAVLVGWVGIAGAGMAWMFASLTEAGMFAWALRRRTQLSVGRFVLVPVVCACAATLLTQVLPARSSSSLVNGIAIAVAALAAYTALSLVFNRDAVVAALRRVRALR